MTNIPDKLGIGNEVREFKLGRSFMGNSATAFHSIRYDFKPASVDTSKMATLAIGERHQVTVTVPHIEGNAQAVFMGSKKQYQKECVFIIDHNTGEITLEKLSSNIQLKKTRSEGSSRSLQNRPITPIDVASHPPPPPPPPPPVNHTKKPTPPRYSPSSSQQLQKSGLSSPIRSSSWSNLSPQTSPNNPTSNPSMPNILGTILPPVPGVRQVSNRSSNRISPSMPQFLSKETKDVPEAPEIGILSGSSSDSSSSSDNSTKNKKKKKQKKKNSSSSSSASSSAANSDSDDPDENLRTDHRRKTTASNTTSQSAVNSSVLPSMPSMPKFSQLSQDLQLSESGSDSDG